MEKPAKKRMQEFRSRMYAAGYKQKIIWVPRVEGKAVKMERQIFLGQLEELTAGWSKARLSRLFYDVLKIIKKKIREEERAQ